MAIHRRVQVRDKTLRKRKRKRNPPMNRLALFGVYGGLMLLLGSMLYFPVVSIQGDVPSAFVLYVPPAEDGLPMNTSAAKELTSRLVDTNPTVTPNVIVARNAVGAEASPVSVDTIEDIGFDQMDMMRGMDLGDGLGETGGGLGGRKAGGSSLEGTFYDLKLSRDGRPSGAGKGRSEGDEQACGRKVQRFFKSWDESVLSAYYRSPQKLYASSFYVPCVKNEYGPIAYKCDDVCEPGGWMVVYRGRVRAPKTGKFRFVGTGDDYIGVRFDDEVVLEAGYRIPSLFDEKNQKAWCASGTGDRDNYWKAVKSGKLKRFEGYELIPFIAELKEWNSDLGGMTAGKVFEVEKGKVYPIQIAVGDIPGGGGVVVFSLSKISPMVKGFTPARSMTYSALISRFPTGRSCSISYRRRRARRGSL